MIPMLADILRDKLSDQPILLSQITSLLKSSLRDVNVKPKDNEDYDLKTTLNEIFNSKIYKNKLAEIAEEEAEQEEEVEKRKSKESDELIIK